MVHRRPSCEFGLLSLNPKSETQTAALQGRRFSCTKGGSSITPFSRRAGCRPSHGARFHRRVGLQLQPRSHGSPAIPQGLEPRTVCLEGRCSILLSYGTKPGPLPSGAKMARELHTGQAPARWGMKKGKAWTFPFLIRQADVPDILTFLRRDLKPCCPSFRLSFSSWALRQRPWPNSSLQPCLCCMWRPWRRC